ncbi:MAG: competence/damage-inducible protein A [Anaerolineales bacterium]
MPIAEIITIGTEILLGEIDDTNATYLSQRLNAIGVDVYRKTTIGDNAQRIATLIQETLTRSDILITTGGLGPTVDDPTREAVARALGVELQYHPELWEQIEERFHRYHRQPSENNRRQAFLPSIAIAIENPVGTAPAFIVQPGNKTIACLPGVPREMEYIMENSIIPFLKSAYHLKGLIKTRTLHTAGMGESMIDSILSDLETLTNPTVGLAAHSAQVDIRITVKADSDSEANALIKPIEEEIRKRLKENIYGADGETLEQIALESLKSHQWRLVVCESNSDGNLIQRLHRFSDPFIAGEIQSGTLTDEELSAATERFRNFHSVECGLGIAITPNQQTQNITIYLSTPINKKIYSRPYGGPPQYAPIWAGNHALDILRKI